MAAFRHLSIASRRWLMLAVAVALAARLVVPAGWMPVAGPAGVTLALCDAGEPIARMAAHNHHDAAPAQHHHGAPDHPCAFAGAAAAVDTPTLAPPSLPAPVVIAVAARLAGGVAVGRGLAAPPPLPTGPPLLA